MILWIKKLMESFKSQLKKQNLCTDSSTINQRIEDQQKLIEKLQSDIDNLHLEFNKAANIIIVMSGQITILSEVLKENSNAQNQLVKQVVSIMELIHSMENDSKMEKMIKLKYDISSDPYN